MGFFDQFTKARDTNSQQQQQQQQPANPANPPLANTAAHAQADPHRASDPANPVLGTNPGSSNNLPANPPAPETPKSGLDAFEELWQSKPTDNNANAKSLDLNIDSSQLDEVVAKLDFSQGMPKEVMEKFQEGDVAAVQQMMSHMTANAYKTSLQHAMALVNNNLSERQKALPDLIQQSVRTNLTDAAIQDSDVPNRQSPTIQRELRRVANQFKEANPSASPQQIAHATRQYFDELRTAMSPAPTKTAEQTQLSWDDWLATEE